MSEKILLIYYSRTGHTEKIMKYLSEKVEGELVEIKEDKDRSGIIGYIKSAIDNVKKNQPKIKPIECNLVDYDKIIIGTPVWVSKMAAPVRTFLTQHKDDIKEAVFITSQKGTVLEKVFADMRDVFGKEELYSLGIQEKEMDTDLWKEKLDRLTTKI